MLSRIISEVVPGTKIHAALDIPSMIGYRTFDTNNDKAKEKNMFAWGYPAIISVHTWTIASAFKKTTICCSPTGVLFRILSSIYERVFCETLLTVFARISIINV